MDRVCFMKTIYLLILILNLSASTTAAIRRGICDACFDGICYSRSQIFKEFPISGQLAVDREENVIYFHYEVSEAVDRTVAFDLDDIRFLTVPNIAFSFGRTVDQATRAVYIGGATGIYKYDPVTNVTSLYGLQNKTIWHMQFMDVLYYTMFLNKGLYIFDKKKVKSVAALADYMLDDFIIDKRGDIYFMSNFTLYKLKKGDKKPAIFSNIIYSLSTDVYGNAYFVQRETRGLYKIDYRTDRLIEMGAFGSGDPLRSVFDRFNNIIYYDAKTSQLYYLVPTYAICEVKTEELGGRLKKMVARI